MENKHVAFDAELCRANPEAAADRIAALESELARTARNRDMWKGQSERQAAELTELRATAATLEQTIQNGAEMIRGLTARIEAAEAKGATWRLAYLVGMDEPQPGRKIVALNDDGSGAMMFWVHDDGLIEAEGDDCTMVWFQSNFIWWSYIPDTVEFWCETRTDDPMTLKRLGAPAYDPTTQPFDEPFRHVDAEAPSHD